MTRLFALAILIIITNFYEFAFAQDLLKARGSSQMVLEDNMSKEDLKEELIRLAKINAIENEFGSLIEQESRIEINEGGSSFNIVGERYLKGEWLKTTHENFSEEYRKVKGKGKKDFELWMSCEITGLIREISKPEINFEFIPTNCPEKICRTTDFINGESMYLYFKSPVNGYLSVFTVETSEAFRILPYQQMPGEYSQHLPVVADTEYLFFNTGSENNIYSELSAEYADELIMVTETEEEYIDLVVIFSTEDFIKPTLDHSYQSEGYDNIIPRSLPKFEFESWLSENRIRTENFHYKKLRLKIYQ